MSKGAKKSGGSHDRAMREMYGPRKPSTRKPKKTVLLVGSGKETEPNYFRALVQEASIASEFAVTVKTGPGQSPDRIVSWTMEVRKKTPNHFDEAVCVLDVEDSQHRKALDKAIALALKNKITLYLSNPCFEVWLLSHFEKTSRAFTNYDGVLPVLNTHWKRHFNQDYAKSDENLYKRLSSMTETAIHNAKWVREKHFGLKKLTGKTADCDSCTEIYHLVEYLLGRLKKNKKDSQANNL